MDRTHEIVGWQSDDAEGFESGAVRPFPGIPEPGERERFLGFQIDEPWDFGSLFPCKFIEAIDRNDAATALQKSFVHRTLIQPFYLRVHRAVGKLHVFFVRWNQWPVHLAAFVARIGS